MPVKCRMVVEPSAELPPSTLVAEKGIKVAIHPGYPEQTITIGGSLSEKGRMKLCDLLKNNVDVFDWKPTDMTIVPRSIAEHRRNIREGFSPIRQKKRGQALDRNRAIQEEVTKLVEAHIMREVHYHRWLSNTVMVKKHDGSWRMCVDFTDLNKSCPKDYHPLLEIDWKVESLYGYPFKCFPNAYKGYHQIQMTTEDEEKTTFHTSQVVYCYTKMSFGLKNAIAIYQRLVDKAFEKNIGRKLESRRSRALQSPKINYNPMEKLILALVHATRRLRRYFQAHLVGVIMDQPIQQVPSQPKNTRRMAKWTVELGEHGSSYRPKTSIRGQILDYFIAEKIEEEPPATDIPVEEEIL
ncbi:reverse transcriptase domain-containing protein [Tanacetum coccineum]